MNTPTGSPSSLRSFAEGVANRVRPAPDEWDHGRYLKYRRRVAARLGAKLARLLGVPTAMPPRPDRPAFLPERSPSGENYETKLRRRFDRLRNSNANDTAR